MDQQQLIDQHPELADELRSFFANRAALERVAEPLKGAAYEPTVGLAVEGAAGDFPRVRYFGDYELLEELGRGGMGVVYKARQTTLNRLVALKMILLGQLASADDVQRFKQEAEAAANLDHPHIAPIYETGEHEGQHYFSMKFIEGRSLREAMPNLRDDKRAGVTLLSQVARAVHHAHQRGVLHRDLKPANVLLDQEGTPYVTDFGLAKRVEGGSDVTKTGAIVGTPSYMAPEQAMGEKLLSTVVDVYSLGSMLYEMLTGRPPFRDESPLKTLLMVQSSEPPRPRSLNPKADRDLETIALKCLEKDPARRYDSAAALADELQRWLRGEPIVARRASLRERGVKWVRRKPAAAALVAMGIVAPLVLIVVLAISRANIERAYQNEQRAYQNEQLAYQNERRVSTFSRVGLAHSLWRQGQVDRAEEQLDNCPNDLRGWEWHYLKRLCRSEILSLPTSAAPASLWSNTDAAEGLLSARALAGPDSMTFSPDGRRLFIAPFETRVNMRLEDPPNVQIVDADTGRQTHLLSGHGKSRIMSISLDRAASRVAVGSEERITVWDVEQGKPIFSHTLAKDPRRWRVVVALSGDGRWLAWSADEQVHVRDLESGEEILSVPNATGAIAFTPDGTGILLDAFERVEEKAEGNQFTSAHAKGLGLQLWEIATGKVLRTMDESHDGENWNIAISPNGHYAAADDGSYTTDDIRIWELQSGRLKTTIRNGGDNIAFSADGQRIAALNRASSMAAVWSVDGQPLGAVRGVRQPFAVHPDGRRIAGLDSRKHSVRIWDVETAQESTHVRVPTNHACFDFSPDGDEIVITNEPLSSERIVENADGTKARVRTWEDTATVWDVAKRVRVRTIATIPKDNCMVRDVVWSPDGTFIAAVSSWNGEPSDPFCELKVWNAADGRELLTLQRPPETRLRFLAVSPDSRQIALGGEPETVEVVDAASGKVALTIPLRGVRVAFHPSGRWLAVSVRLSGAGRDRVEVWDLISNQRRHLLAFDPRWGGAPDTLAYSPDGRYLASAIAGDVMVWDSASGKEVTKLSRAEAGKVKSLAFTPDGQRLAVATTVVYGGEEGTLDLWDVSTAQVVLSLHGPTAAAERIGFSRDGHRLASVVRRAVYFWDATPLPAAKP